MLIQQAYQQLVLQLSAIYDNQEAANIADWVMEHITAQKKINRIINKTVELSEVQQEVLEKITSQLLQHKPVQYVLQESWFAGMKFYVDESVLIPRPETEELVEWIKANCKEKKIKSESLLDIGTGSGCIAIALKKQLALTTITAIDISDKALTVAKKNASQLNSTINFSILDFLNENEWVQLPRFDIIVSNPPYIAATEINTMHTNVFGYEPHQALFVADNNPLLFYKKIVAFAKEHLSINGNIFIELNESLANNTMQLFIEAGYVCELKKDMQGKERMLKALIQQN